MSALSTQDEDVDLFQWMSISAQLHSTAIGGVRVLSYVSAGSKNINMSTIASPRETSVTGGRRVPLISTPTSSSRPSLDHPRSSEASPSRGPSSTALPPKRNRAALREYYNLKNNNATPSTSTTTTNAASASDTTSDTTSIHDFPTSANSPLSELDSETFDAEEFVKRVLEEQGLSELLATYNLVLGDIRALDADRKSLVYDNYSKLIAATETIKRMKGEMEGKNESEVAGLDTRVQAVWEKADRLRGQSGRGEDGAKGAKSANGAKIDVNGKETQKRRLKSVVLNVLECPERVRRLVEYGKVDEAKREWQGTRDTLLRWKARGVGGEDVQDCIEDGDAALRGEPATEKSWANMKEQEVAL